jgi:hypothetical protein
MTTTRNERITRYTLRTLWGTTALLVAAFPALVILNATQSPLLAPIATIATIVGMGGLFIAAIGGAAFPHHD